MRRATIYPKEKDFCNIVISIIYVRWYYVEVCFMTYVYCIVLPPEFLFCHFINISVLRNYM